jgi:membrane protein YdbS with pleckstrin-like domain
MPVLPSKWPWGLRFAVVERGPQQSRDEVPRELYRYLATTETTLLGGQVHWAVMVLPVSAFIGGTLGIFWMYVRLAEGSDAAKNLLALGWVALVAWVAWRWLEWNRDLIFITGYRIIKVHGIVVRRVAMMPISKVTDMTYNRTPLGMLLGYGTFIVESAGQDQALSEIHFVPEPDRTYQHIQDTLFKKVPTDVNLVNVSTPKRVNIGWTGRFRKDPGGDGGRVDQDDTSPW